MASESRWSSSGTGVRAGIFAGVLLFSCFSLNWYSPYVRPYSLSLLGFVGAFMGAIALFRFSDWAAFCRRIEQRAGGMAPRTRLAFFVWGGLAPLAISYFVLDPIPHIPDGFGYLYQAKLFSLGKLWAEVPAFPEFFPAPWSVNLDGRSFSIFPPGWPMLLSLGVRAGMPWAVNPILAGLASWVMWHLWRELFDTRRANLALILCSLSPFFLFMSASFMSHSASLLASSLFALSFLKGVRRNSLGWGAVAALAIGFHILVRPLSALCIFAPIVLFFALFARSTASWLITGCAILGSGIGSVAYGIYNRALVGVWGVPLINFSAPANHYGFGADVGLQWASSFPTPGHDLWRALLNLNFNMVVMNNDLLGWPLASLAFVMICLLLGQRSWQRRFCAGIIAAFVVCYAGYWYNGVAFGARFYYCLLPYLIILTIEGVRTLAELLSTGPYRMPRRRSNTFVGSLLIFFSLYGASVYIPRVALTAPYWNQRKISYELYAELQQIVRPGDLVLVESHSDERYHPLFVKNDIPIEESPVIYAWDRGDEENRRLLAHFPDRRVRRWRYPTERLSEEEPIFRLRRVWPWLQRHPRSD